MSGALPHDDPPYARTLARGLDLLLCFRPGETDLGHRELARRLGLSGPTVVRLTHTLTELGYLRRDAATARYRLGAAVLTLGYPLLANMRVRQVARPAMQAFSEQIGGSVSLGFRHQTSMVYAETAWRSDGRSLPPDTGAPLPMLSTAMGRAWLCRATPADRHSVLNQLRVLEPASHARFAPAIDRALQEFEAKGYCSSRGDYLREVYAFAVPFSQAVDSTLFVMNCGVLATHHSFAEAARRVALPLLELVRQIEVALGIREVD
ncbi:MAG: IclR family transcriptional regulator [Cupriavidus necator]